MLTLLQSVFAVSVITSKSLRPKIMVGIVFEKKMTENLTKRGKMLPIQHIFKANVAQGRYFKRQMRTARTQNEIKQTCTGPNFSYSRGRITETKLDDFCKRNMER